MLSIAGLAFSQAVDPKLTFDAVSVKAAEMPTPNGRGMIMIQPPSGGPGTKDPGRVRYPFTTLRNLLQIAYDVKPHQITGPSFLDSERFEITATMPPTTSKEQFQVMLQNLLAERFKLAIHRETKELPMYSLSVAKGGPKLKESAPVEPPKEGDGDPPPPPPLPSGPPKIGPDGFPMLPSLLGGRGGIFFIGMPGKLRMMAQRATMKELADRLTQQVGKPVSDDTNLTAKYDFTLTFSSEGLTSSMMLMGPSGMPAGGAAVSGPGPGGPDGGRGPGPEAEAPADLFHALQEQIGLRLDSKKGQVAMISVDHIEKTPTEN
jgi:uncharacterized protein (TIGR03435 family)